MWLDDKTCYNTVHTSWNKPVFGSPPFKLHSKIKNVKKALNIWNTTQFGNCQKKIQDIQEHIKTVQLLDKSSNNVALDTALQVQLDIWLSRTQTLWMQKVKDKRLKDGDANTKYFHLTAIIHARKNRISSVKCLNNIVFSDWDSIGNCFFSYYSCLFKSDIVAIPTYDFVQENLIFFYL